MAEDFLWSSLTFQFQRHQVMGPRLYRQPAFELVTRLTLLRGLLSCPSLTSLLLPRRTGGRVRFELTLLAPRALKNDCCLSLHLNSFITACYHYTIFHISSPGWTRTNDVSLWGFYRPLPSLLGIPSYIQGTLNLMLNL